ncbi:MAG: DNA alkylation repair protein [Thermoplasmata archaeon]|jgi:3-methyladenine DNA glycosylase AlkD|nr:DNA alkylation repair protein [Thermoplasmata archaeon]
MKRGKKPSYSDIIAEIKRGRDPEAVAGMARYGISPEGNYGICTPILFGLAKRAGKDHDLAQRLWASGIRDARIVAFKVDDPKLVTDEQMDRWVKDFSSWDICDGTCLHLFADAKPARKKAMQWSKSRSEFVKRAGYVMMAVLAVHDKKSGDETFKPFFALIVKGATDERNYVKKAVNWALRQLGKRSLELNREAVAVARKIQELDSKAARWIAADALRELTDEKVQERLRKKAAKG